MFKKLLLTVLSTLAVTSATHLDFKIQAPTKAGTKVGNMTIDDTIHFLAGVMYGIVQEDHVDYFIGCVNGTETLVSDVETMIEDFMLPTFWDIIDGINEIKKFIFVDLPPTIENCGDIPEDFTKLGKFFSIFSNSTLLTQRLEYNLLWYYSDIMTDVNSALTFYSQGQYFNFGDKIGEALVLAVGDHSSSLPFSHKMGFKKREHMRREEHMPRHIRKALKLAKKFSMFN
jgi:hypothetical protein